MYVCVYMGVMCVRESFEYNIEFRTARPIILTRAVAVSFVSYAVLRFSSRHVRDAAGAPAYYFFSYVWSPVNRF